MPRRHPKTRLADSPKVRTRKMSAAASTYPHRSAAFRLQEHGTGLPPQQLPTPASSGALQPPKGCAPMRICSAKNVQTPGCQAASPTGGSGSAAPPEIKGRKNDCIFPDKEISEDAMEGSAHKIGTLASALLAARSGEGWAAIAESVPASPRHSARQLPLHR